MTSHRLKGWQMPPLSTLLVVAVACATALAPHASLAQPSQVTFRGFQFDPAALERATAEQLRQLGIEDGLQAGAPGGNDVPHWRFLQFARPIDRETRSALVAMGLELQRYMAGMYLERVTLDTVEALRSNGVLRASVRYHPAFKLSPSIRGARLLEPRTFQTDGRRAVQGSLLRASIFPVMDLDATAREIVRLGGLDVIVEDNQRFGGPGLVVFRLEGAGDERTRALINVARIDEIESIEEVGEIVPDNAGAARVNQSGPIAAQHTIWNRGLRGQGQVIGIFDFGVADTDHCFFKDPANNMPGPNHRKLREVRDPTGYSEYGPPQHATQVASIAAGADFNASSIHDDARGGAYAARLVLANIYNFYSVPGVHVAPSTLPAELAAVAATANVFSFSWHNNNEGYSATAVAFDLFARTHEDHVVVASAGKPTLTWGPPAISKNSIAVSAASLDTMQITDGFPSNPFPNRQKPDLAAAGCGIVTATQGTTCGAAGLSVCATSYAAPQAAAIAALARQYYVDGEYPGVPQPTASLIKATLINSARDVGQGNLPSAREGWGIVRLDSTLAFPDSDRDLWIDDVRNTDMKALQTNGQRDYAFEVKADSQPLKVTLVWTDPPGAVDQSGQVNNLVNNLDLEVMSPGTSLTPGVTYLGNRFNASIGKSIPGPPADTTNNVEQVIVDPPPVGIWLLRVKAQNIAIVESGLLGQGYALVATAARPMEETETNGPRPNPPTNLHVVP